MDLLSNEEQFGELTLNSSVGNSAEEEFGAVGLDKNDGSSDPERQTRIAYQ